MAKFKCKQSGNIVEFMLDVDIESMRQMPHYEEVKETPKEQEKTEFKNKNIGNSEIAKK